MSNTTSSGAPNRFNMGKVKSEREWERVRETKTKEEWAPTEHTMEAQDFDNIIEKVVEQKRDIQTGANVFYKIPGSFAIFGEIEYLVERFNILSVDEKKIKIHWKPTPKNIAGNSTATAIHNPARTRSAYWNEELVAPSTVKLQEKIDGLQEKVDDLMEKYNSVQEAIRKMQEEKDNREQQ